MRRRRRGAAAAQGGFTLLEMMIALSILAISLTWLIEASARAVDAENHAKLVTNATFLARRVLVELEDQLQEKGMQDDSFASEKGGTFEEEGFKRFTWSCIVDKITLPGTDVIQTALGGAATGNAPGGGGPGAGGSAMGALGGMGIPGMSLGGASSASFMSNQFGIIKDVLEQGIRRATCRIIWTEHGNERTVEVSEYLTDPRRVDQAIQIPALPGLPGTPGTNPQRTQGGQGNTGPTANPPMR